LIFKTLLKIIQEKKLLIFPHNGRDIGCFDINAETTQLELMFMISDFLK
jgi:hypothetical protein